MHPSVWYNLSEMLKLSIFRWNHSTQVAGIISATIFPSSFIITVFFCLISSCLTLLCCLRFPSTSSLTLLWPFTLSSSFTLFAWNSLLLRLLFSFSCPSSSSPLHPVSPSLTFPPSSSLFLPGQRFSWCLTKHGICIGKMPQNMACRQRRRWKWSGISYQMSSWPRQPSLLSRENRSPLWRPMTQTYTQTHVCAGIPTYDFVH